MTEKLLDLLLKRTQIGGADYMTRWHLAILGPLAEIYLHKFVGGDKGRDSHDHPWLLNFTIVLRGGYIERLYHKGKYQDDKAVNWFALRLGRAEHQLSSVEPPTWTIFIGLFRWREWGFWRETGEFIPNDDYRGQRH